VAEAKEIPQPSDAASPLPPLKPIETIDHHCLAVCGSTKVSSNPDAVAVPEPLANLVGQAFKSPTEGSPMTTRPFHASAPRRRHCVPFLRIQFPHCLGVPAVVGHQREAPPLTRPPIVAAQAVGRRSRRITSTILPSRSAKTNFQPLDTKPSVACRRSLLGITGIMFPIPKPYSLRHVKQKVAAAAGLQVAQEVLHGNTLVPLIAIPAGGGSDGRFESNGQRIAESDYSNPRPSDSRTMPTPTAVYCGSRTGPTRRQGAARDRQQNWL